MARLAALAAAAVVIDGVKARVKFRQVLSSAVKPGA
jgi:hypothetical protein